MSTLSRAEIEPILDNFPAPAHLLGPCVYRARSADRLLYVGMSTNLRPRLRIHRNGAAWWREMTCVDVQFYVGRKEALRHEWRAIHVEGPAYNRHRPRRTDQ